MLGFVDLMTSVTTSLLWNDRAKVAIRQYVNEWAWLFSNKTLWMLKFKFHIIFISWDILFLYFSTIEKPKKFPSSWAKQVSSQIWLVSNVCWPQTNVIISASGMAIGICLMDLLPSHMDEKHRFLGNQLLLKSLWEWFSPELLTTSYSRWFTMWSKPRHTLWIMEGRQCGESPCLLSKLS